MHRQPRIVHIADASELASLLEDPDLASLRLERRGVLFRLSRESEVEPKVSETNSDEAVLRHLDRAFGAWKRAGIDAEAFKEYLRERRAIRPRRSVRR